MTHFLRDPRAVTCGAAAALIWSHRELSCSSRCTDECVLRSSSPVLSDAPGCNALLAETDPVVLRTAPLAAFLACHSVRDGAQDQEMLAPLQLTRGISSCFQRVIKQRKTTQPRPKYQPAARHWTPLIIMASHALAFSDRCCRPRSCRSFSLSSLS